MFKFLKSLSFYIIFLTVLIHIQMLWWLFFFFDFQKEYYQLLEKNDKLILKILNKELVKSYPSYVVFDSSLQKYRIDQSILIQREKEKLRKQFMLISEASFFLVVFLLISILILKYYSRLQRLLQEKTIFLNSFTHELKTPITAIKLNLQTLLKRQNKNSLTVDLIESSIKEINMLNEKISRILYNRDIKIQPIKKASMIHIKNILESVLKELEKEIADKKASIKIITKIPLLEQKLYLPSQWLFFLLKELVLNSLKYSSKHVKIQIIISEEKKYFKKYLKLTIIDNGWGIPDSSKVMKSLFLPYTRYHEDKGYIEGTGLGLYYVREILKKSRGKIKLKNLDPGLKIEIFILKV